MEGLKKEQLGLSALHSDQQKCCNEFLGCVTFGRKQLQCRKKLMLDDTSYQLRYECVSPGGRMATEHDDMAAVKDTVTRCARMRKLSGLQPLQVEVKCLHKGYGFTVRGGCPARVGHVRQGSSAQLAGLREGDYITHINGCDVTALSKQEIAQVVRQANTDVTLDIRRRNEESPWQQEIVNSMEDLRLEQMGIQSDVLVDSSWQQRTGKREEGKTEEDVRGSSSDVTFSLLSVPVEEQERQSAIESIHVLEEEFVTQMQCGIQRFSRPLRHCLISSKQHATLFQNVEKLVTISEYYLGHLKHTNVESDSSGIGSGDDDIISRDIGAIYRSKVKMCSEAYRVYNAGLTQSIQLLGSLMLQPLVISFLQDAEKVDGTDGLTIEDFLCKPIQHLEQLYRGFERILLYTSPHNADHDNLQHVVRVLRNACAHDSSVCQRSSHSVTSVGSRSQRSMRRQHREKSDNSSKETRKTAEMIMSDRPMLFSGQLVSICAATYRPLVAVLMEDALLMMCADSEGHMTLVGEPLSLRDIVRVQFECDHSFDFILSTQKDGATATRKYRLRAGCYDDKVAWRNVLERQIKACVSPRKVWSVSV